jgi:hypothetical protein
MLAMIGARHKNGVANVSGAGLLSGKARQLVVITRSMRVLPQVG